MSLYNLLDDGVPANSAESWTKIKVSSINTGEINATDLIVADITTGNATITGDLAVEGDINTSEIDILDSAGSEITKFGIEDSYISVKPDGVDPYYKIINFLPGGGSNFHNNGRIDVYTQSVPVGEDPPNPTAAIYFNGGINIGSYLSSVLDPPVDSYENYSSTLLRQFISRTTTSSNDEGNNIANFESATIDYIYMNSKLSFNLTAVGTDDMTVVADLETAIIFEDVVLHDLLGAETVSQYYCFFSADSVLIRIAIKKGIATPQVKLILSDPNDGNLPLGTVLFKSGNVYNF